MKRLLPVGLLLLVVSLPAWADSVLWYNGDFDGLGDVANQINGSGYDNARAYDDFIVPSGGWVVDTVWSNNLFDAPADVTLAHWEIRSGVSAGDGGTLLAGGDSPATMIDTGRPGIYGDEYSIQVSGLNVPLGSGTYWLSVTPILTSGDWDSFISATTGANAVGTPPGNDGNSFFDWESNGYIWATTADATGYTLDLSMGVSGDPAGPGPVPEPCTFALFGLGALGLLRRRVRN